MSEHFPDPTVRKSVDVDLALLERYDALITDLELTIVREANRHDGEAFHRLAVGTRHRQSPGADHPVRGS